MKIRFAKYGFSLTEMVVVVAILALLTGFGLPAIRSLQKSFETGSGVTATINAALSTARAIAAKEQRYAGVRFQQDLDGNQYMIFILQDPAIMEYGFRAVKGVSPIKLPENIIVMDLVLVERNYNSGNHQNYITAETEINSDTKISDEKDITDIASFSILFSPTGKLVVHKVQVRNKDGLVDSSSNSNVSYDDVFNKKLQVDQKYNGYGVNDSPPGAGMFYQDDYYNSGNNLNSYGDLGLGPEFSRSSLIICQKDKFKEVFEDDYSDTNYLQQVSAQRLYVNAYTGTLIITK